MTAAEIIEFVRQAMAISDRRTVLALGAVENAGLIQQKTGFNVAGYSRLLDNYGVRHTLSSHGNAKRELLRGQIAVAVEDFALIPLITAQPDDIFYGGKNRVGRDVLVFAKVIGGNGYRHVEEIRGKHKLVATDSMRKKKGAWSA